MSEILINTHLAEIDRLRRITDRSTEQIVREAFKELLKNWAKARGLHFAAELEHETVSGASAFGLLNASELEGRSIRQNPNLSHATLIHSFILSFNAH